MSSGNLPLAGANCQGGISGADSGRDASFFAPDAATLAAWNDEWRADHYERVDRERRRAGVAAMVARNGRNAAGLVSLRISRREDEPSEPQTFQEGREWPFRHVCTDRAAARAAEDNYFGGGRETCRRAGMDWKWKAVVTLLPGGMTIKQTGPPGRAGKVAPGGIRGEISSFSYQSRKNLMLKLMAFPWDRYAAAGKKARYGRAGFVTLTYPDAFPMDAAGDLDAKKIKRDLDTLRKRLDRFPAFKGFLWKMELEPRKSGKNAGKVAPHFHCIAVFREPVVFKTFRRWLSGVWADVVASGDERHRKAGTRVDSIFNPGTGRLMNYLGKYIGKAQETAVKAGRFWGIFGKFDQAKPLHRETDNFTRWEFAAENIREYGKKSKHLRGFQPYHKGITIYGSPAEMEKILEDLFQVAETDLLLKVSLSQSEKLENARFRLVNILNNFNHARRGLYD